MAHRIVTKFARLLPILIGCIVSAAVIYMTAQATSQYLTQKTTDAEQGCHSSGMRREVVIEHGKATPSHIAASKCDTLVITNRDHETRLLAFGQHDRHVVYDGITEKWLDKDQSLSVTLDRVGSYRFHDHYHDDVVGTFTVAR